VRCWQDGRLIDETVEVRSLPAGSASAELRGTSEGALTQLLDLRTALCVVESRAVGAK